MVLAITLSFAGAIATSSGEWQPPETAELSSTADLLAPGQDAEEAVQPAGPTLHVPVQSARLSDEVVSESVKPAIVRVAGIGLEATILPVGVDDNNQFAVPAADTVGWYEHSSSPGTAGASVLAAHVDYGGRPGAFFNLAEVLPGDTLEVEMEDGTVIAYMVTGNTIYDKTELPADELFRKEGDSVLQLITCGGTFNPQKHSYNANVVVTAEPVTA
jgi:LPXTG-site transpeptidase (sortase) family protein